jgi:hypothetical protein
VRQLLLAVRMRGGREGHPARRTSDTRAGMTALAAAALRSMAAASTSPPSSSWPSSGTWTAWGVRAGRASEARVAVGWAGSDRLRSRAGPRGLGAPSGPRSRRAPSAAVRARAPPALARAAPRTARAGRPVRLPPPRRPRAGRRPQRPRRPPGTPWPWRARLRRRAVGRADQQGGRVARRPVALLGAGVPPAHLRACPGSGPAAPPRTPCTAAPPARRPGHTAPPAASAGRCAGRGSGAAKKGTHSGRNPRHCAGQHLQDALGCEGSLQRRQQRRGLLHRHQPEAGLEGGRAPRAGQGCQRRAHALGACRSERLPVPLRLGHAPRAARSTWGLRALRNRNAASADSSWGWQLGTWRARTVRVKGEEGTSAPCGSGHLHVPHPQAAAARPGAVSRGSGCAVAGLPGRAGPGPPGCGRRLGREPPGPGGAAAPGGRAQPRGARCGGGGDGREGLLGWAREGQLRGAGLPERWAAPGCTTRVRAHLSRPDKRLSAAARPSKPGRRSGSVRARASRMHSVATVAATGAWRGSTSWRSRPNASWATGGPPAGQPGCLAAAGHRGWRRRDVPPPHLASCVTLARACRPSPCPTLRARPCPACCW